MSRFDRHRLSRGALAEREDSGPRCPAVYAALDHFRAHALRQGGINLIAAGMRDGNAEHLEAGLDLMRHHLGEIIKRD